MEKGFKVEFAEGEKVKARQEHFQFNEICIIEETILYKNKGTKFIKAKIETLREKENAEDEIFKLFWRDI